MKQQRKRRKININLWDTNFQQKPTGPPGVRTVLAYWPVDAEAVLAASMVKRQPSAECTVELREVTCLQTRDVLGLVLHLTRGVSWQLLG